MSRLASSSFALLLLACASSCGDEATTPKPKTGAGGADGKYDPKTDSGKPKTPPPADEGAGLDDAVADDGADTQAWESEGDDPETDGDTTGGDTGTVVDATGGEPGEPAHLGPCKVTWSSGTVVRFKYTGETGGTINVDVDGNGKPEVCGKFELKGGKPTKVTVDDGCDKKTDLEITTKALADLNLATAKVVDKASGKTSDLTLVSMPSFSGVIPGYPMRSAKKKIGLTDRDGLVRTANVKKPTEGPTVKVRFFYDGNGRMKTVKEDQGSDGSVDQRYDYRYDASGNVTRVTLTRTAGELSAKTTAKLDYSCWK